MLPSGDNLLLSLSSTRESLCAAGQRVRNRFDGYNCPIDADERVNWLHAWKKLKIFHVASFFFLYIIFNVFKIVSFVRMANRLKSF